MSRHLPILFIITLLLCFSRLSNAYWPTNIDGELSLAGSDSTLQPKNPVAMAYPNGSVLVSFIAWPPGGYAFNIIDRFGELVFDNPQSLRPGSLPIVFNDPIHLVPDMEGGAYIVWSLNAYGDSAIYAQHIDTLGNLLWGDDAVQIFPIYTTDFEVCLNSDGGLLLAVAPEVDVYAQRIDTDGNLLWGDSLGIAVSNVPNQAERYPVITSDGHEGCFIVWEDHRTGGAYGDLYAQHFDGEGNALWDEDMLICGSPWNFMVVSDSSGGFILQAGPMGAFDSNKHFRYDGDGNLLWEQYYLSYYSIEKDKIVPGEPGYYYLGYGHEWGFWGQRIDAGGNPYWPIYPVNWGAPFSEFANMGLYRESEHNYSYRYPNFYGIYTYHDIARDIDYLYANALDTMGNPLAGENGVLIDTSLTTWRKKTNVVGTDDGGIICVYEWAIFSFYHVVAKRANFDGTLGGPLHLLVDLESQNPPIQIPPGGGSFQFNVAIEDTYVVEGKFDAWIEVTLPNGRELEILHRDNITIQPNSVIQRPNMTQAVPANAPAGNYIYHLYVGSYNYDVIWAEDSLEFVKIE